jgi:hypothetical protein
VACLGFAPVLQGLAWMFVAVSKITRPFMLPSAAPRQCEPPRDDVVAAAADLGKGGAQAPCPWASPVGPADLTGEE